jgi:hypothetical protein
MDTFSAQKIDQERRRFFDRIVTVYEVGESQLPGSKHLQQQLYIMVGKE